VLTRSQEFWRRNFKITGLSQVRLEMAEPPDKLVDLLTAIQGNVCIINCTVVAQKFCIMVTKAVFFNRSRDCLGVETGEGGTLFQK